MVARDRTFAPGHLTSDNRLPLKLFQMNVVWDMNSPGPDESCVRRGPGSSHRKGNFYRGRCSQPYSQEAAAMRPLATLSVAATCH